MKTKYRISKNKKDGYYYPQWKDLWPFWQNFSKDKGFYLETTRFPSEIEASDFIHEYCREEAQKEAIKQRHIQAAKDYIPKEIICPNK